MSDLMSRLPVAGEVWKHTKSDRYYLIEGAAFNAVTDRVDVVYKPLYQSAFALCTRQIQGHEKAFLSTNEDGAPRFTREARDYATWFKGITKGMDL